MATIPLVEVKNYDGVVILGHQTAAGVDNAQDNDFTLPASIESCDLLEVAILGEVLDVIQARFLTNVHVGPWVSMKAITSASPEKDFVGNAVWVVHSVAVGTARLSAVVKPDSPVRWTRDFSARVVFEEIDTDATPTAVVTYMFRVQLRDRLTFMPAMM